MVSVLHTNLISCRAGFVLGTSMVSWCLHGIFINSRFQSPFYVQRQVFRQHYERFSKIFRKSKVLRHFRNYFANPNHPEFWEPFRTFGIIGKFSEPFRDFGIFLHMAGHNCAPNKERIHSSSVPYTPGSVRKLCAHLLQESSNSYMKESA